MFFNKFWMGGLGQLHTANIFFIVCDLLSIFHLVSMMSKSSVWWTAAEELSFFMFIAFYPLRILPCCRSQRVLRDSSRIYIQCVALLSTSDYLLCMVWGNDWYFFYLVWKISCSSPKCWKTFLSLLTFFGSLLESGRWCKATISKLYHLKSENVCMTHKSSWRLLLRKCSFLDLPVCCMHGLLQVQIIVLRHRSTDTGH